jgi:uncharacterized protein YjiS (DUF1127 family)
MSSLSLSLPKQTKLVELICAAFAGLVAILQAYLAWRTSSAIKKALYQLDDRTLKDIGLHRSEIASAVNSCMSDRGRELICVLPIMLKLKSDVLANGYAGAGGRAGLSAMRESSPLGEDIRRVIRYLADMALVARESKCNSTE